MKVEFKSSFANKGLRREIQEVIEQVEQAQDLRAVNNLKPLRGGSGRYYRIKLGDYRMGLAVDHDTVLFVRFLHRKEMYRYFP